jgi:AraC family transcriptional regulator of arabinose operon
MLLSYPLFLLLFTGVDHAPPTCFCTCTGLLLMLDNNDIYRISKTMEKPFRANVIDFFKESLWNQSVASRSSCVVPLYAERYRGIRNSKQLTAHDYWEFTGVASGSGYFYADTKYSISTGTAILVPPGLRHYEHADQKIDTVWMGFKATLPGLSRNCIYQLHSDRFIKKLVSFWDFSSHHFNRTGTELDGMLLALIGLFFRELNECKQPFHDIAQQAVQFLNKNFNEHISMTGLAASLHCSEGHLFRKFKEFTGETPITYLNSIRIKQAAFYLKNTNLQINHIANLCGFDDPYYFSRIFHKVNGQSPKRYREMTTAG